MDSSLNHRGVGVGVGGLNAFNWNQIFALDSAVVEVQEMFSSHLTYAPNHITVNYMHFALIDNTNWKQKFIDNLKIKPYKDNSAVPL